MDNDDGGREWSAEIRADSRRQGGRIASRWLKEESGGRSEQGGGAMAGQFFASGGGASMGTTADDVANTPRNDDHNRSASIHSAIITRQHHSRTFNDGRTPPAVHTSFDTSIQISNTPDNLINTFPALNIPTTQSPNIPIPTLTTTDKSLNPFPNINSHQSANQFSPIILNRPATITNNTPLLTNQAMIFTSQTMDPPTETQKITRTTRASPKPKVYTRSVSLTDPNSNRTRPDKKPKTITPRPNPNQYPPGPSTASEIAENLETQTEKKRRRNDEDSSQEVISQNEHFLTAGPGSQACRDQ
jgi:hypothetical protein